MGLLRFVFLLVALMVLSPGRASAVLPIEQWTAPSGARVLFVRAPAIPMVDVAVVFDAGSRRDPAQRSGLAALTAGMLDAGVPGLDEEQIAQALAEVGAQRGLNLSEDRVSVSLRCLSSASELEQALRITELTLRAPLFPEAVLARERERSIAALRESLTQPDYLAREAFDALLYPDHPYGRKPDQTSLGAISREDLIAFHRRHYRAADAVVAIIGDLDRAAAQAIAQRLTAGLPKGDAQALPPMPPVAIPKASERRLDHPASQSHLMIGSTSIAWGDPAQFALTVGNHILGGGGFTSRLTEQVRERRGLAYAVFSQVAPRLQPGPFIVQLQTQKEQTGEALRVVRETLARFAAEGPTEAELQAAKANLVGGFALRIDSNRKILENLAHIGFHRLPADYLARWTERVQAVDAKTIRDAFAGLLREEALVTVVVGGPAP